LGGREFHHEDHEGHEGWEKFLIFDLPFLTEKGWGFWKWGGANLSKGCKQRGGLGFSW
jgi:hypothetical protein